MLIPAIPSVVISGGVGFIAGAFCPAVLRKIKALFVKESSAVKAEAVAVEKKL